MKLRRLSAVLALTAAALVAAQGAPPGAGALEQATFKVGPEQTVEAEYPPIPLSFPLPSLPENKLITPEDCRQAPYCAVVPFEITPAADLEESDEFFVTLELSWVTERIPEGPKVTIPDREEEPLYSETLLNDLDLYVWDDPVPAEEIEPHEIAASGDLPETLKMFRPTKGRYQIVVMNYSGPNQGFKLKAEYRSEKIEAPFELLEPSFEFLPPAPTAPSATAPAVQRELLEEDEPFVPALPARSVASAPEATPPADLAPLPSVALPALSPALIEPDADFAGFDDSEFDDELAGPADLDDGVLRQKQAAAIGPARPASAGSLVLWLLLVPALLVGGTGTWLWRRSAGAVRVR